MLSAETVPSVTKDQTFVPFPTLIPPGTEHIPLPDSVKKSATTTPTMMTMTIPTVDPKDMEVDTEGVVDIKVKGGELEEDKPFYKKWWFWAIVAGVVVTGASVYIFTRKKKVA